MEGDVAFTLERCMTLTIDEMNALMVEAVIASVIRGLAKAAEIFRAGIIRYVVLARNGMQFRDR
jgi:hypothetical protein